MRPSSASTLPSPVAGATTGEPDLDDATVGRALLRGLMECDPASPRVALATVRALRRAERSHTDRVVAVVHACAASMRQGEPLESVKQHLADLAPFERSAAVRLLGTHHAAPVDEPPAAAPTSRGSKALKVGRWPRPGRRTAPARGR